MAYKFKTAIICGLVVYVVQNSYDGLWYIRYQIGGDYAGPYKTKREAIERMRQFSEGEG